MLKTYSYTDLQANQFTIEFEKVGIRRTYPLPSTADLNALCNGVKKWKEVVWGAEFEVPAQLFKDVRKLIFTAKRAEKGKHYAA